MEATPGDHISCCLVKEAVTSITRNRDQSVRSSEGPLGQIIFAVINSGRTVVIRNIYGKFLGPDIEFRTRSYHSRTVSPECEYCLLCPVGTRTRGYCCCTAESSSNGIPASYKQLWKLSHDTTADSTSNSGSPTNAIKGLSKFDGRKPSDFHDWRQEIVSLLDLE